MLRFHPRTLDGRFLKCFICPKIIGEHAVHHHLKCVNMGEAAAAPNGFECCCHAPMLTQEYPAVNACWINTSHQLFVSVSD